MVARSIDGAYGAFVAISIAASLATTFLLLGTGTRLWRVEGGRGESDECRISDPTRLGLG